MRAARVLPIVALLAIAGAVSALSGIRGSDAVVQPSGPVAEAASEDRVPVCGKVVGYCVMGEAEEDLRRSIELLDSDGPEAALAYLKGEVAAGVSWMTNCHALLHVLGRETVRQHDLALSLAANNRLCEDGYQDGVMEGFAKYADEDTFWEGVARACDAMIDTDDPWKASSCAHGIGHALVYRGLGEYEDVVVHCDKMREEIREACGGGAIMASIDYQDHAGTGRANKYTSMTPDEVDDACDDVPLLYAKPCLTFQWTMYPGEWDVETMLGWLAGSCPTAPVVASCFYGYGGALYQKALIQAELRGDTPAETQAAALPLIERCYDVPAAYVPNCIDGVINSAVWWYINVSGTTGKGPYLSLCGAARPAERSGCERTEDIMLSGHCCGNFATPPWTSREVIEARADAYTRPRD